MNTKIKCFWCRGRSKLGVHSKCWKVFTGFMLSKRTVADMTEVENDTGEYLPHGQTYRSASGFNVKEGRVMPCMVDADGGEGRAD